jgi:ribosomal protein L6P/L9E
MAEKLNAMIAVIGIDNIRVGSFAAEAVSAGRRPTTRMPRKLT